MIIPDNKRPEYFANLIGGLAMYMAGPYTLKLFFQGFVVLVGVLILSGAVNTAIVGANGVLNRIGRRRRADVLVPQAAQASIGTTHRMINMIAVLQLLTIMLSRGNVYLLAALYAFGVIWSFAFKSLAVLVLRFTEPGTASGKFRATCTLAGVEIPDRAWR